MERKKALRIMAIHKSHPTISFRDIRDVKVVDYDDSCQKADKDSQP